jgi:hypothetical protein
MHLVLPETMTPFRMIAEWKVGRKDKDFILETMQMDWRD